MEAKVSWQGRLAWRLAALALAAVGAAATLFIYARLTSADILEMRFKGLNSPSWTQRIVAPENIARPQ